MSFSQDELIKVTNEKRMLGEQLKDFRDSNRAHLEIENKRLQDNLQNQKTEHEQNQKWLKSQNDTLMRKQQVNPNSGRTQGTSGGRCPWTEPKMFYLEFG